MFGRKKVSERRYLLSDLRVVLPLVAPARCGRGAALSFDDAEWGVGNASG